MGFAVVVRLKEKPVGLVGRTMFVTTGELYCSLCAIENANWERLLLLLLLASNLG